MKNLVKDYIYGFADGFGKTSLLIPYLYASFNKENDEIKDEQKNPKYSIKGFNHGIKLGFFSCAVQIIVYLDLASHGHPEYLAIPGGTNIFSFLYEKFKYFWAEKTKN
jgi:hypothetical protein